MKRTTCSDAFLAVTLVVWGLHGSDGYARADPKMPPSSTPAGEGTGRSSAVSPAATEVFDPNAPPVTTIPIAPYLTFGGRAKLEYELNENFDLEDARDRDFSVLQPELSLALSFDPSRHFQLYVNPVLTRQYLLEEGTEGKNRVRDPRLEIALAFVALKDLPDGLSLSAGRQRHRDPREWLYDDTLDAARLGYHWSRFSLDFSVNRKNLWDRDVLNRDRKDKSERFNNYFLYANYRPAEEIDVAAFVLVQNGRSSEREHRQFFGLQSEGEIFDDLEYWLQFAHLRGRDGSKKIRGVGLDLGLTYEFDHSLKPSITLGYAFGSGDDDPNNDTDKSFRQTDLQDNSDKFNGVTRFKYYGEVLDPELSNLSIFTVGIGIRPSRRSSLDLVYHYDVQQHANRRIRGDDLDVNPTGRNREIGSEIDLIAGYREIKNLDMALTLGYFIPDRAFADKNNDSAFLTKLEVRYNF